MLRRLLALACLPALVLPAAAMADPPWSPTQNLSTPHLFVDPVDVTASGDQTALAWWSWQDGTGRQASTGDKVRVRGSMSAKDTRRPFQATA